VVRLAALPLCVAAGALLRGPAPRDGGWALSLAGSAVVLVLVATTVWQLTRPNASWTRCLLSWKVMIAALVLMLFWGAAETSHYN
jgi:hypothetical protein